MVLGTKISTRFKADTFDVVHRPDILNPIYKWRKEMGKLSKSTNIRFYKKGYESCLLAICLNGQPVIQKLLWAN